MYQHLSKYEHFAHIIDLLRLPDIDASTTEINRNKWSQFLFLEALHIKNLAPKINDGLEATRKLVLFR